ncbi:hypothetical protein FTO68_01860 [Methanocalculus taiwanensis]|uniref:DUF4129 domain-containing protein n=1 Tax=Methanocalculus taiwanensis TaxID=106207 RepID=A0ABD4TJ01_9EURY|nr:hypothetical protein [Methanocalculus taiwanensis]MCQ1537738.1 hypothetical protein [Methanocalculus taiwanensis]
MKKKSRAQTLRLPAIALVACICILLILPHTATPALYTPKMDAETDLHDRVSVLRQATQDNSGVILPLMEDIFSSSGTLVLNLNVKDFNSAQRDLDQYLAQTRQFDNLVIRLDMSQSDLEEWKRLNAQNKDDLMALFEDTQRFSELKQLEIKYRDADNPDMLYSIMYEGEALKSKIKETVASYESRSEKMVSVSEKFGVKTEAYEESVRNTKTISEDVEEEQEERSVVIQREVPRKEPLRLHLGIEPFEVRYGDILTISGRITGTDKRVVSLYLDSRPFINLTAAADGTFLHKYQIDKIRTGMHTLYATMEGAYSDVRSFQVIRSETNLILQHTGETQVSGQLMSRDRPVSGAPIRILSAGKQIATPTTNANGGFVTTLKLAIGKHHIVAVFDEAAYPLERFESDEVVIIIKTPEEPPSLIPFIQKKPVNEDEDTPDNTYLFIITALFVGGAAGYFYLKRRSTGTASPLPEEIPTQIEETPPEPEEPEESPLEDVEEETIIIDGILEAPDPALEAYHKLQESDLPAALRSLFLGLAQQAGIENPLTATAGDIRQTRAADTVLHAWLAAYELVLYGGQIPDAGDRQWLVDTYQRLRDERG